MGTYLRAGLRTSRRPAGHAIKLHQQKGVVVTARVLACLLGVLLVVAAGLKLHGLNLGPASQGGWWTAPWLQALAIVWEIGLGSWLLFGRHRAGAWLAAVATLILFAGVSASAALAGRPSCGCFGEAHVNPWFTFALDLVFLGALAIWRPAERLAVFGAALRANWVGVAVAPLAIAALTVGLVGLLKQIGFGTAAPDDERPVQFPAAVSVGVGQADEWRLATFEVTNNTAEPLRLIAGTMDCSCDATTDLPLTVPAYASRPLTIRVKSRPTPGEFARWAHVLTAGSPPRKLEILVTGTVDGTAP